MSMVVAALDLPAMSLLCQASATSRDPACRLSAAVVLDKGDLANNHYDYGSYRPSVI